MLSLTVVSMLVFTGCGQDETYEQYRIDPSKKLVVFTSHKEDVYSPIIREFEERTGICVEVKAGNTITLMDELRENNGAGCDVMFGGGIENFYAYQDCFAPYEAKGLNEVDDSLVPESHKWTPFSNLPIVFIYNTKLVYPASAPRSYGELLTDRWKGKVAFGDPARSGSSYTALCTLIQNAQAEGLYETPEEVIARFGQTLDGHICSSSGAVLDDVDAGTRLVGLCLEETALSRIDKGADFDVIYPTDGTSAVPDAAAIVNNAPNRENAELFLDFTIDRDTQRLLGDSFYRRSVRKDFPSFQSTDDKLRISHYDTLWAADNMDYLLSVCKEVLP